MANIGTADRVIRLAAGVGLLVWGWTQKNWLGALGIVPLATALIRFCPLYAVLGIRTCKKE